MNPLASMKKKLEPLGVYTLESGSLVDAELEVYASEFTRALEFLAELQRELFIRTAQSYGLDLREQAFGPKRDYLEEDARREMLLYRGAVTVNDFRKADIEKAMIACGLEASLYEPMDGQTLYFNCTGLIDEFHTQEEVEAAAEEFLPAHLAAEFDLRILTWDYIDGLDLTFDGMDTKDLTWDQIDAYQQA